MIPLKEFDDILDLMRAEDPRLYYHSERVGSMAYSLGLEFSVSRGDLDRLYVAGLLHDLSVFYLKRLLVNDRVHGLGEVVVPKLVLASPLASAALVASHPGYEYVALLIAEYGERAAGGEGTPLGLTVDDVHVYSFFVQVADEYDRARMAGSTHNEAAALLRSSGEAKYPRKLVTSFLKVLLNDEDLHYDYSSLD